MYVEGPIRKENKATDNDSLKCLQIWIRLEENETGFVILVGEWEIN